MREISCSQISDTVAKLCTEANYYLPSDVKEALERFSKNEKSPIGQGILNEILENADIAATESLPICQDTGMAIFFVEMGQDVHITGGDFYDAVNQGVAKGYTEGYLRKSIVKDPIRRKNTGDNTPAVVHLSLVPGENIKITIAPKGFGSENMSRLGMLKPSDGEEGVCDFIVNAAVEAGPNPCPPIVVGVGIGGNMEKAAMMAKHALTRPIGEHHKDPYYENLEKILLERINRSGVGPQGFGGSTTALAVQIETFPTHIAGLPVAVNISCHVTRHKTAVL